jgi:hypothetical protein
VCVCVCVCVCEGNMFFTELQVYMYRSYAVK